MAHENVANLLSTMKSDEMPAKTKESHNIQYFCAILISIHWSDRFRQKCCVTEIMLDKMPVFGSNMLLKYILYVVLRKCPDNSNNNNNNDNDNNNNILCSLDKMCFNPLHCTSLQIFACTVHNPLH